MRSFVLRSTLALGLTSLIAAAPRATAQQVISTETIVSALGRTKGSGRRTEVEFEAQKNVKAVLADVVKITTIESSTKVKVEKTIQKAYVPFIDLDVYFDFDEAIVTEKAKVKLDPLAHALNNPRFKQATFVLAGHTDATGKAEYNRDLSLRRAKAVKDYLIAGFKFPGQRLVDAGFGETHLKDKGNPTSAINRRVQIINIGR